METFFFFFKLRWCCWIKSLGLLCPKLGPATAYFLHVTLVSYIPVFHFVASSFFLFFCFFWLLFFFLSPSLSTSAPELRAGRSLTTHRLVSRSKTGQRREALAVLQWLFQRRWVDNAFFSPPCHKADALLQQDNARPI